ncbi:MAG: ABC transporter ATP-binding protein [Burkholderiaceae bacterium]|nr:ABC transporter ATP-binding protein [Burkholderiaceae bacterium]MCD8517211.1 ABC transporter ATP-binding protein [Burkholderiaceae bacterium]MCD8536478.1 ABC transporter ATP-binding protein [Burkholderiaceae bacterium]MCD8565242.1 ABC transporter ATP-binding protein [Burkholderiaceae bacterium]
MELTLKHVSKTVSGQPYLYPMDLRLEPNQVTVLLGATQAGKTTLMRIMAGLDRPTEGQIRVDGKDVTGVPVRERNVAMVYQQFINYPSMTVFDNIASPLKLAKASNIEAQVEALAQKLHIEMFLKRLPSELSGGQQQRVALARALAKSAPLMLLDEPLVNLDYKLREELRSELSQLFAAGQSTVVYATTEPGEALLLGGYTAVMDKGELLQYGPTAAVFHRPASVRVAKAFSDPPINLLKAERTETGLKLSTGQILNIDLPRAAPKELTVGVRASALKLASRDSDVPLAGKVELAEISGSDTFVHVQTALGALVAQLTGVHEFDLGADVTLHISPDNVYVFENDGPLLVAPKLSREVA